MGRPVEPKIPLAKLKTIAYYLFNKAALSGGDLCRRLDRDYFTVRRWLMQDGLPPAEAYEIAEVMDDWAMELRDGAARLRMLAKDVERQTKEAKAKVRAKAKAKARPKV